MFSRFLIVGLASLAFACGIALVGYKVLGNPDGRKPVSSQNVVVATVDLPMGARIRPQDVRIASVPRELAPQNCFEKLDDVKDRVVTNLIVKDEPVVGSRLAAPGSAPGLAPMIPPGYRAVAVRVNDVIGVAGFIQPGMRVDVLATGRLAGSEDSVTRTVLQNVVVLSAGQVLQPEPKGQVINAQVVTLQVRPDEAEVLTLTSAEARIQLVLRNSSDSAMAQTPGAHLAAIYNVGASAQPAVVRHVDRPATAVVKLPTPPVPPPAPTPAPPRSVEVIRGTTRSDVAMPHETERKSGVENKKVTRRIYVSYTFA